MDDGMEPMDDWSETDEPTEPLPVIRHGRRTPMRGPQHAEMPPLPPAVPRWPPREREHSPMASAQWPSAGTRRFGGIERALQAARERQLSLGCGALAAIVLLGALVFAALGGNFAGLGGSPFVPRPNIQAAPRPTATMLPTPTATPRPTPTPSPLPTATPSPTPTPPPTPSPSPSPSPTPAPSPTPQPSPTSGSTPVPSPSVAPNRTTEPPASPVPVPNGA